MGKRSASRSSSRTSAAPAARSAREVADAAPDGYTRAHAPHRHVDRAGAVPQPRRTTRSTDFETIGLVTDVPMTIIARKDFAPKTLKELVDYVKANNDKVTYANAGIGAASHLCGLLFQSAIDVEAHEVPYKGTGPAMNDLLGGQVDFMCDQTTNTTGQIKAGKVKAYAVTTPERVERCRTCRRPREVGPRSPGHRLARPLRAGGHAQAGDRHPVGGASGSAGGPA